MKTKFCERITELRKSSGMSQKTASAKLGISQALLSHYEKGIRECGLDFVLKLAQLYDTSCDYILGRTVTKSDGESLHAESKALECALRCTEKIGDRTSRTAIKKAAALSVYGFIRTIDSDESRFSFTDKVCSSLGMALPGIYLAAVTEKADISDENTDSIIRDAEALIRTTLNTIPK